MDGEVLLAVERHEVVAVALVVAEKEVLAVLRAVVAPVSACDFDGRGFGVFVPRVGDAAGVEPAENPLPAFVRRRGGRCGAGACRFHSFHGYRALQNSSIFSALDLT